MTLPVLSDVLHLETFGIVEIDLHRRTLPGAAEGILDLDGDLWTLEGASARIEMESNVPAFQGRFQCAGCERPVLFGAN